MLTKTLRATATAIGLVSTLVIAPCAVATAATTSGTVHSHTLDNGMKIFVKEDYRAPVAASMVWYKIGSAHEPEGLTGISHVLEHMMFKGTDKLAPGEFSRIISANGGSQNAFTSRDYTAYFQRLEAERIEISLELEADRMRNMKVIDEEFSKEIQVVMEERRMRTDDKPTSLTYEQFNAAAFTTSPYRSPVIGWMHDLENMTADDIRDWYKIWYAPNNATLVVVGDVDPDNIFKLAEKHFGPLQPSVIKAIKPTPEIPQKGERRITVKAPAELPYLIMGYKAPRIEADDKSWEPYALSVLAAILDGDNSSRFAKHLVREQQIATSAGAGYDAHTLHPGLFLFDGQPAKGRTVDELESAIREQIKLIKTELATDDELARVKAQVVAGKVYEKDSVFYQAMQIGALETIGLGWQVGEAYVNKIQQVSAEQVRAVAQKYLIDDTLTVAILDPQKIDRSQQPLRPLSGMRH